jgi:pre-mRNA-processing factor 40
LAERKALFAKHIQIQKEVEREERLQRAAMDREDFKAMLRSKGVTSTTRYREVMDRLAEEPAFKAIESSKERTTLFEDFIDELRREESEASRTRKRRAVEKFEKLLLNLSEIRLDTSWKTAIDIINRQPEMRSDADLASMEPIEQLIGYENYIKGLERIEQQREIEQRDERHKRQRLNRKAFKALLDEMQIKGYLKATTSWSEFYSFIKGRSELISMLAQPGSTPLDLFWDRIHEMQEKYIVQVKPAFEELKNLYGEDWYIKVTIDDIKRTSEKLDIPTDIVEAIKAHLLPLSRKELVEEKRDTAAITAKVDALRNNNRKLVDRLKHAIKHFDPPITLQSTYEEYRSLLVAHPDIVEVTDDDVRWYYFNKYIRHLRKRAGFEDGNSEEEGEERGGNRIKSSRPHH